MFHHVTVLKEEAVEGLNIQPSGIYVDCTLGGAGHAKQIASRLNGNGCLIGLDQDERALEHAKEKLNPYQDRIKLVKSNFRKLREVLNRLETEHDPKLAKIAAGVHGVLFDLGVSSPQLDEEERGFSYHADAPLDMRMDQSQALTAADIVNEWEVSDIADILFRYSEEKFARSIARNIGEHRAKSPIRTTNELAEIVKNAIPARARRTGPHPARRSFQAIRIAVNDELGAFEEGLEHAIDCLAPGGRIAVITFHSLEDRICKQTFSKWVNTCQCPPDFPVCGCGNKAVLRLINRKPILPTAEEIDLNPRARSAKLRIAEKVEEGNEDV